MKDKIFFTCPGCQQDLDAPLAYAGMSACCPSCDTDLVVPQDSEVHEDHSPSQDLPVQASPDVAPKTEETKSGTMRIDVGDEMVLPEARPRVFKIKRTDHR